MHMIELKSVRNAKFPRVGLVSSLITVLLNSKILPIYDKFKKIKELEMD